MTRIALDKLDQSPALADKGAYEAELKRLQLDLLTIQQSYFRQGRRAILVLEGPDAAGKGGAIRRLAERLDPRGLHVWPIGAPSEDELRRHYLARFWERLPASGSFAIFDRSWYGRVLVERVEELTPKDAWKRAYGEIVDFERMLVNDGTRIVKCLLWITEEEQRDRFVERLENPYKRWKFTEEDLRNRAKWPQYRDAFEDMLERTSIPEAHWHVVPANKKWYARTEVLRIFGDALRAGVEIEMPPLDPDLKKRAAKVLGVKL